MTNEELILMRRIIQRAHKLGIEQGTRTTQAMDIMNAHKQFNLRLEDFLNADSIDFVHDFTGIQAHMNRDTGRCENFFLPRFASHQ